MCASFAPLRVVFDGSLSTHLQIHTFGNVQWTATETKDEIAHAAQRGHRSCVLRELRRLALQVC